MAPSTRNSNRKGLGPALKHGWNSKPAGVTALVVVVVALLVVLASTALGIFAPVNNGQDDAAAPQPTKNTAASGPCNVKVADTSSTPKVPSDLTWKTGAAGLTWPVSKSVGPTRTIDGFDACFARSPLGAALAAQTATYSQYDGKHSVSSALGFYIADSAGKQKSIATSEKQPGAADTRAAGINPAGFTVDAFTKDRAEVTLVYSYPSSSTGYIGMPTSLVWTDDDWKISVLDNGELFTGNLTNPSENDFIPWTGADQ